MGTAIIATGDTGATGADCAMWTITNGAVARPQSLGLGYDPGCWKGQGRARAGKYRFAFATGGEQPHTADVSWRFGWGTRSRGLEETGAALNDATSESYLQNNAYKALGLELLLP